MFPLLGHQVLWVVLMILPLKVPRLGLQPEQMLQHFIGLDGEKECSVWDLKFPLTKFQDRFLMWPIDQKMCHKLELADACRALATEGLRSASLMHWAELEANKMKTALAEKDAALAEKDVVLADKEACILELHSQEGLEALKQKIAKTESELATLKKEKQEAEDFHKISAEEWINKENQLRDRLKALLTDAAKQYVTGFLDAKAQAELFAPGMDFNGMDMFKVIRDGKLVDEEEDGEEEEAA